MVLKRSSRNPCMGLVGLFRVHKEGPSGFDGGQDILWGVLFGVSVRI